MKKKKKPAAEPAKDTPPLFTQLKVDERRESCVIEEQKLRVEFKREIVERFRLLPA